MDLAELNEFANQVIERFKIHLSTSLVRYFFKLISKYNARVLPSLLPYLEKGEEPALLTFH